jgi:hypothetical protein
MERVAPGILFLYLLHAVLLTIPVSLILIWWYRRAVGKSMALAGESDLPAVFDDVPPSVASESYPGRQPSERRLRRRLTLVYMLAALSAAVFWTFLVFQSGGIEFTPLRAFTVTYAHCWPIVPTLIALLAFDRRRSFGILSAYVVLGVLTTIVWTAASHAITGSHDVSALSNGWQAVRLIALYASLPGLILLIVANRRIRGVSPLVLAALLVFTFSSVFFNEFLMRLADHSGLRRILFLFGAERWGLWFLLATVPVGYFCWRLLIVLNRGFQHKSFSDMQFLVDSFWVIVAFVISADLATNLGWKGLWGLAGFVVYRVVAAIGFTLWPVPKEPGVSLLVLRVFGFQRRSEKLFDSVILRWRFRGPVRMIAGTDLAARTIDPDDSLAFASGDLRSRFVGNAKDLRERLQQLDEARDPDGHFRVTEFFCQTNTWMHALVALLAHSDVILMDLRGFSKNRSGCLFELEQLKHHGRLAQTVFVVDSATDLDLFRTAVDQAGTAAPQMNLEQVKTDSISARDRVYRVLQSIPRPLPFRRA